MTVNLVFLVLGVGYCLIVPLAVPLCGERGVPSLFRCQWCWPLAWFLSQCIYLPTGKKKKNKIKFE